MSRWPQPIEANWTDDRALLATLQAVHEYHLQGERLLAERIREMADSKLVSMKISQADREKNNQPAMLAGDAPAYPYGLSLTLDDAALDKLGLETKDLKVGESRILMARVEITSASSHKEQGSKKRESVGLQITSLCLEAEGGKSPEALYDKG